MKIGIQMFVFPNLGSLRNGFLFKESVKVNFSVIKVKHPYTKITHFKVISGKEKYSENDNGLSFAKIAFP